MQLSDSTLQILKNFSSINPSLYFKEGNVLRTVSSHKTVIAKAIVADSFSTGFGIYDLSRFLAVLSLFESPQLTLGDRALVISSGRQKMTYAYADSRTFVSPPDKDLEMKTVVASFQLPTATFQKIMKAAGVLQLPEIAVVGKGETLSVTAADNSKEGSDTFHIELESKNSAEMNFVAAFKVENLRVIPMDYKVEIDSRGLARFTNVSGDLMYWVATEAKTSRFQS
jgi:gp45 sliding clamp, C terminal